MFAAREVGPATIALLVVAQAVLWTVAPAGGRVRRQLPRPAARRRVGPAALDRPRPDQHAAAGRGVVRRDRPRRDLAPPRRDHRPGAAGAARRCSSSGPDGTALGGPLAAIGALGLVGLALWAILPRWQSVVPRPAARPRAGRRATRRWSRDVRRRLRRLRALARAAPHDRAVRRRRASSHGLLDGTPFAGAPVLRWSYVAVGGDRPRRSTSIASCSRASSCRCTTTRWTRCAAVDEGLVEIALRPLGRPLEFAPGQFAMVYLEGKDGWHRHPFTIASAPHEDVVRVTVKALGDYTSRLHELVEPGDAGGDRRPARPLRPLARAPTARSGSPAASASRRS